MCQKTRSQMFLGGKNFTTSFMYLKLRKGLRKIGESKAEIELQKR